MPPEDRRPARITAERWRELDRIIDAALDLAPPERAAWLERACAGDPALHAAAERLLDACERGTAAGGLFATSATVFAAPLLAAANSDAGSENGHERLRDTLRAALAERYEIERELARGGMATVFLARDLRHERTVALKVVEVHAAPGGAARFLAEIRTAARLTHPHVLSLHESGEAEGLLFYVMPYVEGETLRTRLRREGPLPLGDVVRLLRELADALAYAHGRGVVHCDLKPENVLLSEGHAVVADFGIAKAIAAAASGAAGATAFASGLLGTPAYMAPEQATPGASLDARSDLYALGVIGYELLTGRHPFTDRTTAEVLRAHREDPPAPLAPLRPDAPRTLVDLVGRLLAKAPEARPQSAREVRQVLEGIVAAGARPRPSWRAPVAGMALLVIVLLAAAVALLRPAPPVTADLRSIAVLPFVNAGGNVADDYFADGLRDELANTLGAIPGIRLAGRNSSYAFRERQGDAAAIGRALQVGAIVTGTVRRSGERVRVGAELVATADGKVLWDSVFETRSGDVFEVQDELASAMRVAIAPSLRPARVATSARGTDDQEAYDLWLKGRHYTHERGAENVQRAIGSYRQAIARDPEFARAHAGLAFAYAVLPVYLPETADSLYGKLAETAARAVALDSALPDARIVYGLSLELQLRPAEAERHYRAALAAEPANIDGRHMLGMLLQSMGRTDEAVTVLRQATLLDPFAKSAGAAASGALVFARRFPEAIAEARRVLAIDSTFPLARWSLAAAQVFAGQPDSAIIILEAARAADPQQPWPRSTLLFAYAAAGRWRDAASFRAELRRSSADPAADPEVALADLLFGDPEPLLRYLGTPAGRQRWYREYIGFGCNPLLDPLWTDARFRQLMRELQVTPCPHAGPWPFPDRLAAPPAAAEAQA